MTPANPDDAVRAVIDIGTNSVKVLVAKTGKGTVEPVHEESIQTRLGEGLYESGRLQSDAISRTADVVAGFMAQAREFGAGGMRILATSAAREASNGGELRSAIRAACGGELEIIKGELEAEYVYLGVSSQSGLDEEPRFVVDVGGGSTEFIVGDAGSVVFARSFPLGSVRQMAMSDFSDPPGDAAWEECSASIREFLSLKVAAGLRPVMDDLPVRPISLVGTGGTTTFLGMIHLATDEFNRSRLENLRFDRLGVESLSRRLWNMTLDQRCELKGLPSNRADVILFGSVIYLTIMDVFAVEELQLSTRGVRFGTLLAK